MKSVLCETCKAWFVWIGGPKPVCPMCHRAADEPRVPYVLTRNDRALLHALRIQPEVEDDGA